MDLAEADSEFDKLEESGLLPGVLFIGVGLGQALVFVGPKAEGDGGSRSAIPSWCSEVKWGT